MAVLIIKAGLDTWEPEAKNQFISPKISELTAPYPPDIAAQRKYLLNAFILNHTFALSLKNASRQLFFNFIRRTEAAFVEYCLAVESLRAYVQNPNKSVTPYFTALLHFEQCLAQLAQVIDLAKTITAEKQFEKNDGSVAQRLWTLHTWSKHMDRKFAQGSHAEDGSFELLAKQQNAKDPAEVPDFAETATVALWITDSGLECKEASMSFAELAEIILQYYEQAEEIVTYNPKQK